LFGILPDSLAVAAQSFRAYRDAHDLIYMRRPPPEIQPMSTLDGLDGMEEQCNISDE
jgi:hypothetical protein